jgi:hypothetical protein
MRQHVAGTRAVAQIESFTGFANQISQHTKKKYAHIHSERIRNAAKYQSSVYREQA